jgi:hypothetical protein
MLTGPLYPQEIKSQWLRCTYKKVAFNGVFSTVFVKIIPPSDIVKGNKETESKVLFSKGKQTIKTSQILYSVLRFADWVNDTCGKYSDIKRLTNKMP